MVDRVVVDVYYDKSNEYGFIELFIQWFETDCLHRFFLKIANTGKFNFVYCV